MSAPSFDSPEAAEAAFYAAFERGDVGAMMRVWADDDDVVCVHPMGAKLSGRAAVAESWRQIFGSGARLRFRLSHVTRTAGNDLSVHCLHENIRHGPGGSQRALVIATNVYRRAADGWRMVLHHGSPGSGESQTPDPVPPTVLH